jgi:metal transporter CNNM
MSGLTVGYFSIDPVKLELMLHNGNDKEKKMAKRIIPILKNKHLLLVTLLLSNSAAMETLPLCLDAIMPSSVAIILSVTFVLIFGEILPQALCLGKNQFRITSSFVPFVRILIFLLWIICYPISVVLDKIIGHEEASLNLGKKDLRLLLTLNKNKIKKSGADDDLNEEEIKIISSTLDIRNKRVFELMIPLNNCFFLKNTDIIDENLIKKIQNKNYTKIPVFNNSSCVGFLKVKKLLNIGSFTGKQVIELGIDSLPIHIHKYTNLLEALRIMQESKHSILIVIDSISEKNGIIRNLSNSHSKISFKNSSKILGFIFLKDIFEEIIKENMEDDDNHLKSIQYDSFSGKEDDEKLLHHKASDRNLYLNEFNEINDFEGLEEKTGEIKRPLLKNK